MISDTELARRAGVPVGIIAPIRTIESGGNPLAFRFECNKFNEDSTTRVPCTPAPGVRFSRTPSETNRAAFNRAYAINPRVAIESSSFGLYQQLGSTLLRLYSSPAAAIAAFDRDPSGVSARLFEEYFQVRDGLRAAANRQDWRALAEGYNGSDRWYERFMELYSAPRSTGFVAMLIAAGVGYVAWRKWR